MNKLVIIPVCDFYDLLYQIVKFYKGFLDEADIIIVDDSKNILTVLTSNVNNFGAFTITNNKSGDLRNAFLQGLNSAEELFNKKYDLIITNEHDVIPNTDALYACLSVFENNKLMRDIASVSTIYKWQGRDCYPSHPDWYNGWSINNIPGVGECKVLGAQGVPFGFTLWKPNVLRLLNNENLPLLWKLDSRFGELVYSKGYHHIRLIDYYVEHFNGGIKSWKTT